MSVIDDISRLLKNIDNASIECYKYNSPYFIDYVDNKIKNKKDYKALTGSSPFEVVHTNHSNHAEFMYHIFLIKDAHTMHRTYIWAYRTYFRLGFSFRYFYYELIAWRDSFEEKDKKVLSPIIELYNHLISLHEYFIKNATSTKNELPKNIDIDNKVYNEFLNTLLKPDITEAISISNRYIKTDDDIRDFWEHIILPSLYNIGHKWAEAEISVGEEHTATSICQRVMSEHYKKIIPHIRDKKNILVTTSPNELHEVGARMLSDILELNGYDVFFVSSKSSNEKKSNAVLEEKIDFVLISTTLVGNILETKELIKKIRDKLKPNLPKIIIGGQAFIHAENATELVDADYCLNSTDQLLALLKEDQ